jgi:hypothetical protein
MATERAKRLTKAKLRQQVAAETIAWCQRLHDRAFARWAGESDRRAAALEIHDLHARHSRELGRTDMAERAEERFDRELNRITHRSDRED